MADAVLRYLRQTLPAEVATLIESQINLLETGEYETLLRTPEAQSLFGHNDEKAVDEDWSASFNWSEFISRRLNAQISATHESEIEKQVPYFLVGYAALLLFVQSNVTGPPLQFAIADILFPKSVAQDRKLLKHLRQNLLSNLGVDGISAYKLTPNLELLCLADAIVASPALLKNIKAARWIKSRVSFMRQRLLSEVSSTLQNDIYDDLDLLEELLTEGSVEKEIYNEFVLERSTVHIHHGLDKLARKDLDTATIERQFKFALTGLLGKRTKFQSNDISQLVVLAKSHATDRSETDQDRSQPNGSTSEPTNIDLNDDTLLESISFTQKPSQPTSTDLTASDVLPTSLKALDPSNQPQLLPLDSIILLQLASSITNTSPQDGLTREETLPYATRVLEGGSSNWQVYTQALLVRSRIEGYRSRTIERGLLQLQALVDQVIADTTTDLSGAQSNNTAPTFLPKAKASESAPVAERVRYVFQLASPTRWELEAELASRWVSLGGLRSALDIYERLEMWAEAALCWAATEREDKAKRIVRRQLFHSSKASLDVTEEEVDQDDDNEEWTGPARQPPPLDAPRLYCILGDIDHSVEMYEQAWQVSNQRYARAQRSLGRHYIAAHDYVRAAEAYSKSLRVNQLNHNSWFALGCALLELAQFSKAVEAFSRCVQLDDTDAESWSNLGAAILRTDPDDHIIATSQPRLDDDDDDDDDVEEPPNSNDPESTSSSSRSKDPLQRLRQDALSALRRAAALKRDSARIWENVLTVAAMLDPPAYATVLTAQQRVLALRGAQDGERALDVDILETLVAHAIASSADGRYDAAAPGLPRLLVRFVDEQVVPVITASARLWRLVSRLALWRGKPGSALEAEEKAWRAVTAQPGWETESEARWDEVVDATVRLCDAYESLGPQERTEGMGAGEELVAKDWKFKARTAVRGIRGKGKSTWEGTPGWDRLTDAMEGLKA